MAFFQSPNYTQTPNDFFELAADMGEAELKVTLAIIRRTFGFHRTKVRISYSKLEKATGMSRQGVLNGAVAAEARGTVKRIQDGGVTLWELQVDEEVEPDDPEPTPVPEQKPAPLPGGVEWKIAHGLPVTQGDLVSLRDAEDAAHLLSQGNNADLYELALAFIKERQILPSLAKKDMSRWRVGLRRMKQARPNPVQPEHVRQAIKKSIEEGLTVTWPGGVAQIAIDLANPAPEAEADCTKKFPFNAPGMKEGDGRYKYFSERFGEDLVKEYLKCINSKSRS